MAELEDQVENPAITEAQINSHPLRLPESSYTHRYARAYSTPLVCSCISLPLDPEGAIHNPDTQDSDFIYKTVSPSIPRLLNLFLPPSLSSSDSFYLRYQKCRAMLPANTDSRSLRTLHTGILAPVLRRFRMLT